MPSDSQYILICGASGYVGSRLLIELNRLGHSARCIARRLQFVDEFASAKNEWVEADLLKPETLLRVFAGIKTAYYLIHSMASDEDYAELDRQAARNFVRAAEAAAVERVIFLGGLAQETSTLSKHLQSRHETGDILRTGHFHVIEFRASIIIGPGSLSFELVRSLVERLPIMITPKWVAIETQPIFVDDVINYLLQALEIEVTNNPVYEIGGSDVVSYGGLMREYAKQRALRRWMIPVPFLTPRLSSLWLQLVTPLYARVGKQLIASLVNRTVVSHSQARSTFTIQPVGFRAALEKARELEERDFSQLRWSDADSYISQGSLNSRSGHYGRRLFAIERRSTDLTPEQVFSIIEEIGGKKGWYHANFLWSIRGVMDYWFGGIGMRRGRRDPIQLRVGDALDFWRVEALIPSQELRLSAEMRLPGRAWLVFEIKSEEGKSVLYQSAIFDPKGLFGLTYWYCMLPFHKIIFSGLIESILSRAKARASGHR